MFKLSKTRSIVDAPIQNEDLNEDLGINMASEITKAHVINFSQRLCSHAPQNNEVQKLVHITVCRDDLKE